MKNNYSKKNKNVSEIPLELLIGFSGGIFLLFSFFFALCFPVFTA